MKVRDYVVSLMLDCNGEEIDPVTYGDMDIMEQMECDERRVCRLCHQHLREQYYFILAHVHEHVARGELAVVNGRLSVDPPLRLNRLVRPVFGKSKVAIRERASHA